MKILIILAATLFSTQLFAATKKFDVKAEISLDGKVVSNPHIVMQPNELASITQRSGNSDAIIIEVIASDYSLPKAKDGIMMKFTISRNNNGKKTIIGQPQIITHPNETAEITQGKNWRNRIA